jgi:uncharacterized protein (TIGR00290 family)
MKIIYSWSGGKDSCLALYKTIIAEHNILFLLNFISEEYKRCCFHGISNELMKLQSDAIGIPIIQKEVPADMEKYETEFKSAVIEIKNRYKIDGMGFGDIYLQEHKSWVERVCNEIGIIPIEPLWNINPVEVIKEFIDFGFKAKIVSAKADLFPEDFLGKDIDYKLLEYLLMRKVCPCGENGEFHTFVYDGPIFKKYINLIETEKILKDNYWKHWFLDIKKFELIDK